MQTEVKPPQGPHSSGHRCFFPSCRFPSCLELQADAIKYGFRSDGEVAVPEKVKLPWEDS